MSGLFPKHFPLCFFEMLTPQRSPLPFPGTFPRILEKRMRGTFLFKGPTHAPLFPSPHPLPFAFKEVEIVLLRIFYFSTGKLVPPPQHLGGDVFLPQTVGQSGFKGVSFPTSTFIPDPPPDDAHHYPPSSGPPTFFRKKNDFPPISLIFS